MNWYWVRERGERMEEESGEGCRELLFFGGEMWESSPSRVR